MSNILDGSKIRTMNIPPTGSDMVPLNPDRDFLSEIVAIIPSINDAANKKTYVGYNIRHIPKDLPQIK